MSVAATTLSVTDQKPADSGDSAAEVAGVVAALRGWFDVEFSIFDGATGTLIHRNDSVPCGDDPVYQELARVVAGGNSPEFIAEEDPVLVLALPVAFPGGRFCVAAGAFVTRHVGPVENLSPSSS